VLGPGTGLRQQLDDALQRTSYLRRKVGCIVALLIAAGLAGQHHPFAGTINHHAM
jgi:hypothetical protein